MTLSEREWSVVKAERLIAAGEPDEALALCNEVLNEDPDCVPALFTAGRIMLKVERFGLAYALNKRCIELLTGKERAAAFNNAGMCAASIPGMLDEAERLLRKALAIEPQSKASLNNMALICVQRSEPRDAIRFAEQSLAIDQNQPGVWESCGYAHLMLSEWAQGWDGYEKVVGHSKHRKDVAYGSEPRWKGETGGRLVVRGEQGIGDEINGASCLSDAMRENVLTLECDRRLEGLFKRSFPGLEIHGTRFDKNAGWLEGRKWDWHAIVGSLAWKYRRTPESFTRAPYLVADPERRAQWRVLLDRLPGLKVGLAWTGGLKSTFRDRRSLSLDTLAPIIAVDGCSFVSLQYRDPTTEIAQLKAKHDLSVTHWARAAQAVDYDEVAALVAELDLIVCVTTAAVDCAGALGKECWVMVPSRPHWRYGLSGTEYPWAKTVKLYRQLGTDWGRVVKQIAGDLRERVNASSFRGCGSAAASGLHGSTDFDSGPVFVPGRGNGAAAGAAAGEAPGAD